MKKTIRKYPVFSLILLHFPAYFLMQVRSFVVPAILGIMLGDIVLSAVQLRLFTRENSDIRTYLLDHLRYLGTKLPVLCLDLVIYLFLNKQDHAESVFWLAVCAVTALLCAFVCLVTGIARTALYHKEK